MAAAVTTTTSLHALLLLSDSALPLGSFAFSSGLESFLAHKKAAENWQKPAFFETFLTQSIENTASTALPYVLAAWQSPELLGRLDNDIDASTPCTVARRASMSQGRALLAVWQRALAHSAQAEDNDTSSGRRCSDACRAINSFALALKPSTLTQRDAGDLVDFPLNAHLAPLFGSVCSAYDLGRLETAYVFLLNHAKAVLSAAIRASVIGPYQSQAILASLQLQQCIRDSVAREEKRLVGDTAVSVPPMDIWIGRHETLYSRIFNS